MTSDIVKINIKNIKGYINCVYNYTQIKKSETMTRQVNAYGASTSIGVMQEMKGDDFQSGMARNPVSVVELSVSAR